MPPQVFLDLGQAFLADGDLISAERTFGLARNLADERGYQREVAAIFETAGKRSEALLRYDRLLRTSPSDVALMARVAKLNEQQGRDDVAFRFYKRGLNLLLAQTPLTTDEDTSKNSSAWSYGGNRDAYQTYSDRLLQGLLVTVPNDSIDSLLDNQRSQIEQNLAQLRKQFEQGRKADLLSDSPRIDKQSTALCRMYFAFDRIQDLESLELTLLDHFRSDKNLLLQFARQRIAQGRYDSVRRLLAQTEPSEEQRRSIETMLGEIDHDKLATDLLGPNEMWQRFLPAWMSGDKELARSILRRVDQSKGSSQTSGIRYLVVNGMLVAQQAGSGATVSSWMRMALQLGDEGLALQFARSRLQQNSRYGATGMKQLFEGYQEILPPDAFQSLVRFAANLYKHDDHRKVEYLWILSQLREYLAGDLPNDEQLLEMIEQSNLSIGYQFPFSLALESFPESVRSQAMAHVIDGVDKKSRPRELVRVPFQHPFPIDAETSQVILDAIKSGIQPAIQDNYLQYAIYYLPRQGTALSCPQNADVAVAALDLLCSKEVRKRDERVFSVAQNVKAVVLHQAGRTDEALDIVVPGYDPDKQITDYYHRYSQQWVLRELIPAAPQRFLNVLDAKIQNGKPTVQQTDGRIAIIRQANDDDLLRKAFQQAIDDHPDQIKYVQQYERWEQAAGRIFHAIAINQHQLEKLGDDESNAVKAKAVKSRLADLWFSVDHRINGLPLWSIADQEDQTRFEQELKTREQAEHEAKAKAISATGKKSENETANPKPDKIEGKQQQTDKVYPNTIVGVKAAMDDGNTLAAKNALREVWRGFPQVVESPYGYRTSSRKINGLMWPSDSTAKRVVPPTETESRETAQRRRSQQRGGLATFTPPPPKPPAQKPESAWKVLAATPWAVTEMRRIQRSRTVAELAAATDVILGLLQADRLQHGDKAVFDSLIDQLEHGHCSVVELTQFFALLEEDPSRIGNDEHAVIDVLLQQFDLTQLKMASQLATVCGSIDQLDRAAALYTHCALLAPAQGVTFASLIQQAGEAFKGEQLMELAERMFAVTRRDESAINRMLDLRMELLTPAEVAERSAELFVRLDDDPLAYPIPQAIRGAQLFAQAGEFGRTLQCLSSAIMRHGKPAPQQTSYYSYGTARPLVVSRSDLIRVFPEDASRFGDYRAWLAAAAARNAQLIAEQTVEPQIAVELQSTIAHRQCQQDQRSAAAESLACVTKDLLSRARKHELLVIDVMREANRIDWALQIETWLHQREQLSHLRFGDLLRDTREIEGPAKAVQLADELLALSLDQDLVAAATDIATGDPDFEQRLSSLVERLQAAEAEFARRTEAAAVRKKTRQQWKAAVSG